MSTVTTATLAGPPATALPKPQHVLALAERMRPGSVLDPRCTVKRAYHFDTEPDLGLLARVLSKVVERHDALRTVPVFDADELVSRRCPPRPAVLEVRTLAEQQQREAITQAGSAPFDLDRGPLLRGTWLRSHQGGVLVLALHHWASDGGALDALQREVADLYAALAHGNACPPAPASYVHQPWQQDSPAESAISEWHDQLAGARRAALPTTGPGRTPGGATALASTSLRPEAHSALLGLAAEYRASPYMILLTALCGLLESRPADGPGSSSDLTVFTTHDTRRSETRRTLGFFAQPLPVRLRIDRDDTFGAAVARTRHAVLWSLSHGDVPLLDLLAARPRLAVPLLRGRRPASLVQYLAPSDLDLDGMRGEIIRGRALPSFQAGVAGEAFPSALPIDLDITVERCRDDSGADSHHVAALYDPGLWGREDIEAALAKMRAIPQLAAAQPDRSMQELARAVTA